MECPKGIQPFPEPATDKTNFEVEVKPFKKRKQSLSQFLLPVLLKNVGVFNVELFFFHAAPSKCL